MMTTLQQIALNMISNSFEQQSGGNAPPWTKEAIECIQNNDAKKGEALANNLCQTMGLTREQALSEFQKMAKGNPMFKSLLQTLNK